MSANTETYPLICAKLVYDGGDSIAIPPQMGTPRADQMQGTVREQLCELAGRICYDSLGTGRGSFTTADGKQGYHDHIREVGHGSVWEHANFTVEIQGVAASKLGLLLNRPGVFVNPNYWMSVDANRTIGSLRITLNLRAAREWSGFNIGRSNAFSYPVERSAALVAPQIAVVHGPPGAVDFGIVEPETDDECWVSMFISGSRGMSHELVRHGDYTAISQRSTRFVDESASDWVEHPLVTVFNERDKSQSQLADREPMPLPSSDVIDVAQGTYQDTVAALEPWLISRGVDKTSARKQARGAARGYLGNALYTELIFSANIAQWKRMLRQRASVFADAEIREVFCQVLGELKLSRYADRFASWRLEPSPDGIGQVAVEGGA